MINLQKRKILITGGSGFIGKEVVRNLKEVRGVTDNNIVISNSKTDDLRYFSNCQKLLKDNKIDVVIHLAARLGGVGYSSKFPATQYYNNILMDLQIVEAAKEQNVEKIVLVSSACAYPKDSVYPITEDQLWNGLPQETNLAYGIGKRILSVQAKAYREEHGLNVVVVIPNNAYGPGDNFDPEYSHVIPSLIRKCFVKEDPLIIWGDGTPTRDFLYVKDFAEGVILAAEKLEDSEPINLGSGQETSIKEVANLIQNLTGNNSKLIFDQSKPNGQPRRSVNISRAQKILGFYPKYSLKQGLRETIEWYKKNYER